MLIPVESIKEYITEIEDIVHIGAHKAEEVLIYARFNAKNVYWIEANPEVFKELEYIIEDMPTHHAISCAVSDVDRGQVVLNVANNGQSSSIYSLGTHEKMHPEVVYTGQVTVGTRTINSLAKEYDFSRVDFMNLDIQGAELLALKGSTDLLPQVKAVYCEVNRDELYKGCALLPEIEDFLGEYGFKNVLMDMTHFGWGDALFVREDAL